MDYRERFELKEYRKGRTLLSRVRLLQIALVLLTGSFLLDFWYLQAVRGGEYARLAEMNRLRKIPLPPYRGTITDRHGEILASTRPSLNLVLRREGTEDLDGQIERLAPILAVDSGDLRADWDRMRGRPTFEPLVLREDVGLSELARIESRRERFPDVEVREGALRSYAAGRDASHVLGYIGEINAAEIEALQDERVERGDVVGKAGVEKAHDGLLRGYRGYTFVSVNNVGRPVGHSSLGVVPEHGQPMRLTIDARLQRVLTESFGDEVGAGVFLDPRNGEVLALVSAPTYDPNAFVGGISREAWSQIQDDPRRPLHNRAIASFYAPGSTFKVLMSIVGLETGAIDPGTTVSCSGSANVYGHTRLCWKRGGHGAVQLRQALTHSCNVYFYRLGQALGIDAIRTYGEMFSLGRPTGVDLPGEQGGILGSDAWKRRVHGEPWYPGDTISVAIGQGLLAVTPMQMATMISGVATGGRVPVPHLDLEAHPEPRQLALHPERLGAVRDALVDVVNVGTAKRAAVRGIQVAAKTGTAQVFKKSAGIDADRLPKHERDHAWLVGYAPAENPQIAFAVVVEHGGHGGTTAAPIVRRVLETFFGVEPSPPPPAPAVEVGTPGALTASARPDEVGRAPVAR